MHAISEAPLPQHNLFDRDGRKGGFVEIPPPSQTPGTPETIPSALATTNVFLGAPIVAGNCLVLTRGIGRFIMRFSRRSRCCWGNVLCAIAAGYFLMWFFA